MAKHTKHTKHKKHTESNIQTKENTKINDPEHLHMKGGSTSYAFYVLFLLFFLVLLVFVLAYLAMNYNLFGVGEDWFNMVGNLARENLVITIFISSLLFIIISFLIYFFYIRNNTTTTITNTNNPGFFSLTNGSISFYLYLFMVLIIIAATIFLTFFIIKNNNSILDWVHDHMLFTIFGSIIIFLILCFFLSYFMQPKSATGSSSTSSSTLSIIIILLKNRLPLYFLFILFIVGLSLLYVYNPKGWVSTTLGRSLLISIIFCGFILFMLNIYNNTFLKSDAESINKNQYSDWYTFLQKTLFFLIGIGVSAGFIYFILYFTGILSGNKNILAVCINMLIVLIALTIVYRFFVNKTSISDIPILGFLFHLILYIPCMFSGILDLFITIPGENTPRFFMSPSNKTYFYILLAIIFIWICYWLVPKAFSYYTLKHGKLLLNKPVSTNEEKIVGNYDTDFKQMNPTDPSNTNVDITYQYGISCWIYLEANSPNASKRYNRYITLLNYGNKPHILYRASTNTFLILYDSSKVELNGLDRPESCPTKDDATGYDVPHVIFKTQNFLLQKWNHIVVNMNGGTLDIFMNGELVTTAQHITPFMNYDTFVVGSDKGLNGQICNVIYFSRPCSSEQIYYLYNMPKDRTPPITEETDRQIIFNNKI